MGNLLSKKRDSTNSTAQGTASSNGRDSDRQSCEATIASSDGPPAVFMKEVLPPCMEDEWVLFELLETAEEQLIQRTMMLFSVLQAAAGNSLELDEESTFSPSSELRVGSNFDGFTLEFPITQLTFDALKDALLQGELLHYVYVLDLIGRTIPILQAEETVPTPTLQRKVVIVGDIHGSFLDVIHILETYSPHDPDILFVFNGDFVDRGKNGIECVIMLCALKLLYPERVVLIRGNHEDLVVNIQYNFSTELTGKYGMMAGRKLLRMASELFSWLPLAAVVGYHFVVHGCIPIEEDLTVAELNTIPRGWIVDKKIPAAIHIADPVTLTERQLSLAHQLLWNDPRPDMIAPYVTGRNRMENCDYFVGRQIIKGFLDRNSLKRVIRAHEEKYLGCEIAMDGQLITVFSSANYMHKRNMGAVYVFYPGEDGYSTPQWRAEDRQLPAGWEGQRMAEMERPVSAGLVGSVHSATIADEDSPLALVTAHVVAHRQELLLEFQRLDQVENGSLTGRLHIHSWACAMNTVLPLVLLPWEDMCVMLGLTMEREDILYDEFLEKLQASIPRKALLEGLYHSLGPLHLVFHLADKNHDGKISREELKDAWFDAKEEMVEKKGKGKELEKHQHLFGGRFDERAVDGDIERIFDALDQNGDGYIDINEFCEANRLLHSQFWFKEITNESEMC